MRYPKAEDIEEMRARGDDPTVIAEQGEHANRRQMAEALQAAIRDAFAGVTLSAGIGLFEAAGLDARANDETLAAYRAMDERLDWRALAPANLKGCSSSLSFFDAEGMRFHIPAYLIADLGDLDGSDDFGLVYTLTCGTLLHEQFAGLNAEQRDVIRAYLQFIGEEPDPDRISDRDRKRIQSALADYWASSTPQAPTSSICVPP